MHGSMKVKSYQYIGISISKFTLAFIYILRVKLKLLSNWRTKKKSKDRGAHQMNPTEMKYNFNSVKKNSVRESTREKNIQTRVLWDVALEDEVTTILRNVDSCLSSDTA
jgi:hypothetical protein